jgi:hypothetical protein
MEIEMGTSDLERVELALRRVANKYLRPNYGDQPATMVTIAQMLGEAATECANLERSKREHDHYVKMQHQAADGYHERDVPKAEKTA